MTKTEIEKKLKDGINERVKMARFFEAMGDNEAAVRCMGFAHAFMVACAWLQELDEDDENIKKA